MLPFSARMVPAGSIAKEAACACPSTVNIEIISHWNPSKTNCNCQLFQSNEVVMHRKHSVISATVELSISIPNTAIPHTVNGTKR